MAGTFRLLAAFSARGEGSEAAGMNALTFAPGATLELDGDSSLHRYSAKARRIDVGVDLDDARATAAEASPDLATLVRGHFVKTFPLVVPVDQLSSGEKGLDENMRKALKGAQYKHIRFPMDSYDVRGPPGRRPCRSVLHGRLSLAGVERRIDVAATGVRVGDGFASPGARSR